MHQDFALLLPLTLDLVQSGLASFALPLLAMQHHPSVELEVSERLLLLGLHLQAVAPEVGPRRVLRSSFARSEAAAKRTPTKRGAGGEFKYPC